MTSFPWLQMAPQPAVDERGSPIVDWFFDLITDSLFEMLWQVENQVAQRREKLQDEGMPQEQLDNVLAEFREQQIKAAKDTKAANSMAKKTGFSWRG